MKKLLIYVCLLYAYSLSAQNVSNIDFYLQDDKLIVTYDLDKDADVYLFASINESDGWNTSFMNWSAYLKEAPALRAVSGDVGRSVQKGNGKKIEWSLLKETLSWFPRNEDGLGQFVVYDEQKKNYHTSTQVLEAVRLRVEAYPTTYEPELIWVDGCDGAGNYWIGKYEVTMKEFSNFIIETGYQTTAEKKGYSYVWDENTNNWVVRNGVTWECDEQGRKRSIDEYSIYPVIHVSYNDASRYCEWLSEKYNKNYILPGYSEWVVIASEVNTCWGMEALPGRYQYSGSDRIDDVGWCNWNSNNSIQPIGKKKMNDYFTYDMSGNVNEWLRELYVIENSRYRIISRSEYIQGKKYVCVGIGGSCFMSPQPITKENDYSSQVLDTETTGANIGFRVMMWVNERNGQSWKNWKAIKF